MENKKLQEIYSKFNINSLTNVQKETIPYLIDNNNLVVKSPTGSGKTLAFVIPIIYKILNNSNYQVLIISPTRELASQTKEYFDSYKDIFNSVLIIGGTSINNQLNSINQNWNVLIATPGRFIDLYKKKIIDSQNINQLIVDEADIMVDMGFIEDIKYIRKNLKNNVLISFFSATYKKETISIYEKLINHEEYFLIESEHDNINKTNNLIAFVKKEDKINLLVKFIKDHQNKSFIIFFNAKKNINKVAREFFNQRFDYEVITSDLTQKQRDKSLEDLKKYKINILLATDIISRGIHIDEIDYVVNFDFPKQKEVYTHRIGRTGRYDKKGNTLSLVSEDEFYFLSKIFPKKQNIILNDYSECLKVDINKIYNAKKVSEKNNEPKQKNINNKNIDFKYNTKKTKKQNKNIKNKIDNINRENANKKIDDFKWGKK